MAGTADRAGMAGITDRLAGAAGAALATAAGALGAVRPSAKPLHPGGDLVDGRVTRHGTPLHAERTGVPWLDEAGEETVLVRVSRAVGLPRAIPDIHGLALRVPHDAGVGDLLLAGTGMGRLTRFLLEPGLTIASRPLTTLLPYRSPTGAVLVGARPTGRTRFELVWARPTGGWTPFGLLAVASGPADDPTVSFDPLLHTLPGLDHYPWVRRLREPAYATARHSR